MNKKTSQSRAARNGKSKAKAKTSSVSQLKDKMLAFMKLEHHLPHHLRSGADATSLRTGRMISRYIRERDRTLKGVQVIEVPRPPTDAMRKDRPLSSLLQNQIDHFQKLESKYPEQERTGLDAGTIRGEADAARYIRVVTRKLHGYREIQVPRPKTAINKNRPASQLLRVQVQHFRHEEEKLPAKQRTGIDSESIRTEGEAAAYIRKITERLHKRKQNTKKR